MSGEVELNRAKVKVRGLKVLLPQVSLPSRFLDQTCNGRPVVCWNFELFDNAWFTSKKQPLSAQCLNKNNQTKDFSISKTKVIQSYVSK
jgi:hypothetical protein